MEITVEHVKAMLVKLGIDVSENTAKLYTSKLRQKISQGEISNEEKKTYKLTNEIIQEKSLKKRKRTNEDNIIEEKNSNGISNEKDIISNGSSHKTSNDTVEWCSSSTTEESSDNEDDDDNEDENTCDSTGNSGSTESEDSEENDIESEEYINKIRSPVIIKKNYKMIKNSDGKFRWIDAAAKERRPRTAPLRTTHTKKRKRKGVINTNISGRNKKKSNINTKGKRKFSRKTIRTMSKRCPQIPYAPSRRSNTSSISYQSTDPVALYSKFRNIWNSDRFLQSKSTINANTAVHNRSRNAKPSWR